MTEEKLNEFAKYDVRSKIEGGIKVDLTLPNGDPSGDWIVVRNFRSERYRKAVVEMQAKRAEQDDKYDAYAERVRLLAYLIAGWSFKTKLTHEAATEFLTQAALVRELVDRVCVDDERFFGKGSSSSSAGQPSSST